MKDLVILIKLLQYKKKLIITPLTLIFWLILSWVHKYLHFVVSTINALPNVPILSHCRERWIKILIKRSIVLTFNFLKKDIIVVLISRETRRNYPLSFCDFMRYKKKQSLGVVFFVELWDERMVFPCYIQQ